MRSSHRLLNTLLGRGLLALALLFAQQAATLHWLSHAVEATKAADSHKAGGIADPCDECLALGALGAAAASSDATPPASPAVHTLVALAAPASAPSLLTLGFRSRAPPLPV